MNISVNIHFHFLKEIELHCDNCKQIMQSIVPPMINWNNNIMLLFHTSYQRNSLRYKCSVEQSNRLLECLSKILLKPQAVVYWNRQQIKSFIHLVLHRVQLIAKNVIIRHGVCVCVGFLSGSVGKVWIKYNHLWTSFVSSYSSDVSEICLVILKSKTVCKHAYV